ncbi:hypothetical protein AGABI2DRAFT_191081 [Agaricus bisporus var. bisporus H97]|uniref:hypothetical protein n=1 Tax=Agaricus bisporus var. bisporus (strain H97 / ATCC MYA-4626 / FGSC 10389) TaxID=936046 RepID=UPI00029F6CB2|nr:hypothetical protein AGABI2DRAFT_191081 [Agaricus bisporus var. bisporus H97]EKV48904.1 hypothetical protein AGABI2DRAFT_191081 [Agaricus bisporus var. bisporus H97]
MRSLPLLSIVFAFTASTQAYWLMGVENFITTERMDPIVNPDKVASHVHSVLGGSNFRFNTNTQALRNSQCTSIPIPEDKSNYWFPLCSSRWSNGSFTSLNGGAVMYYLFDDKPGTTTAFPDDFRMISGDPGLRTYDGNSHAQQAVTFLCLDFDGQSTRHNSLPSGSCPSGIRAQINFPSCWDGKNVDSPDHKSHVAFLSGGPDSGTCSDPKYPVAVPRIFVEVYWSSHDFESVRSQAMNPSQPFVYSHGDPTGYGYHADFFNGWDKGVLQNAVDKCHCNIYGDPTCCVDQGIFHMNKGQTCRITKSINEATTGTIPKLPGNNPVQPEGKRAVMFPDNTSPQLISPVYVYTGDQPTQTGTIVAGGFPVTSSVSPISSIPTSSHGPQPVSSSAITNVQVPSTSTSSITSYAHTIPATTIKFPSQTFTIPSFSVPSIHIPTPSFPHSFPNGNNNGLNSNHNSPNSGGHFIPVDDDDDEELEDRVSVVSRPANSCSGPGNKGKEARQYKSRTEPSKRTLFSEGFEEVKARVGAPPPVPDVTDSRNVRRSHRHRLSQRMAN